MKHAILMLVDKDLDHIKRLISLFDEDFYFFIHIDKKSEIQINDILSITTNGAIIKNVVKEFKINWGGFNMINATILLIETMLNNQDNLEIGYAHLISGQDYLIKSLKSFKEKFENCKLDFIESHPFPIPWSSWKNGGYDRLNYYYFFDQINPKGNWKRLNFGLLKIQRLLRINRSYSYSKYPKLYAGSQWWSLTRNTLEKLIIYLKDHGDFIKRFHNTDAPDEIFISTIISNLKSVDITNNNLRLIDWKERDNNGIMPAQLDNRDWPTISINTSEIFARKLNSSASKELMNLIDKNIINIE
jgi:hypothetical protein